MLRQRREETEEERIARIKRQNEEIRKREQKILEDKKFAEEQGAGFKVTVSNEDWPRATVPSYPDPPKSEPRTSIHSRLTPKNQRQQNGSRDGPPPDPRSFLADEERDYDEPTPNRFSNIEKQSNDFQGRRNERPRGRHSGGRRGDPAERHWKDERRNIDEERIERSKAVDGKTWKREWDQEKQEEPPAHVESVTVEPKRRGGSSGARGGARGYIIRRTVVNERAVQKEPSPPKTSDLDEILQRITEIHVEPSNVKTPSKEPAHIPYPPPNIKSSLPVTSVEYQESQGPSALGARQNNYNSFPTETQDYHQHAQPTGYSTMNEYLLSQQVGEGIYAERHSQSPVIDQKPSKNHLIQKQLTESSPFVSQQSHGQISRSSETYTNELAYEQVIDESQYRNQHVLNQRANSNPYTDHQTQRNNTSNVLINRATDQTIYTKQQHPQGVSDSYLNQHLQNQGSDSNLYSNQHVQHIAAAKYSSSQEEKVTPNSHNKGHVITEHSNNQQLPYQQPTAQIYYSQQDILEKRRAITSVPIEPNTLYSEHASHPGRPTNFSSETMSHYSAESDIPELPDLSVPPPSLVVAPKTIASQISANQPPQFLKKINNTDMEHFNAIKKNDVSLVTPDSEMYSTPIYVTRQPQATNLTPQTQAFVTPQTQTARVTSQTPAPYVTPQTQSVHGTTQIQAGYGTPPTQPAYVTPQAQAVYVNSQSQEAYVTSQTQEPFVASQTLSGYVTPQSQAVNVTPQPQVVFLTPQTQDTYITSRTQPAYITPQTQPAHVISQTQPTHVTSQAQASYGNSQSQQPYGKQQIPITQTYVTPQNQAAYITSQAQKPYVTPHTETVFITPQTQEAYVASQTQKPYVTSQTPAAYVDNAMGYQENPNLTYVPTQTYANTSNVNPYEAEQDTAYYVESQDYSAQSNAQYDHEKNTNQSDLQYHYGKVSSQPIVQYETSAQPNAHYEGLCQANVPYEVSSESNARYQKISSQPNVEYEYENNVRAMTSSHPYYDSNSEPQQESQTHQTQIYYASEPPQNIQMPHEAVPQSTSNMSVQNRLARIKQEKVNWEQNRLQNQPTQDTDTGSPAASKGKGKNFNFLKQAIRQNQESLKEYLAENQESGGDLVTAVQDIRSLLDVKSQHDVRSQQDVRSRRDVRSAVTSGSFTAQTDGESRYRQPNNQSNATPRTKNFRPRPNLEATKSPGTNNKFNVNFSDYEQNSSRQYSGRSRQSTPHNNLHSRSGAANRPHGESPKSFKTIESTLPNTDSGVESYLQEKLSKAKQDRGSRGDSRDTKKQSSSPKDKKPDLDRTSEKKPEAPVRLDWSSMCENSTELLEREAKAKGISVAELETLNASSALQDSSVSNSTNPADKATESSSASCPNRTNPNETVDSANVACDQNEKPDAKTGEVEEIIEDADEEDEEWEDLSDEEDKKKSKKKSGRMYGGYYGRY